MLALLIIDLQNASVSGEPPAIEADAVVRRINALAAAVRPRGLVVIIQHTDPDEGFSRDSEAWQLVPALDQKPGDLRLEKTACDAFLETELETLLQRHGVTEVIITGCATEFCVDTTARAAASRCFQVCVASDAHTTSDQPYLPAHKIIEHHNQSLAGLLLPRQRKLRVATTAELLAELTSTS